MGNQKENQTYIENNYTANSPPTTTAIQISFNSSIDQTQQGNKKIKHPKVVSSVPSRLSPNKQLLQKENINALSNSYNNNNNNNNSFHSNNSYHLPKIPNHSNVTSKTDLRIKQETQKNSAYSNLPQIN